MEAAAKTLKRVHWSRRKSVAIFLDTENLDL